MKTNGSYTQDRQVEAGLSNYVFGKVMPSATDLEQAVIGAMLVDRDSVPEIMDLLRPESFYATQNREIFIAIRSLHSRQEPVDILTVVQELKATDRIESVGGGYYVTELSHRVASSANVEYHSRILLQKEMQRRLIDIATATIRDAYEDTTDAFELLSKTEQGIFEISKKLFNRDASHVSESTRAVLQQMEAAMTKGGITGIESGLYQFDKEIGGFQKGNLYVIAARPGMGKTAWIGTAAMNISHGGKAVGLFSLEMSSTQLTERFLSAKSGVSVSRLKNGELTDMDWQDTQTAVEFVNGLPIYIDDTPGLSIFALRTRARRMIQKYGIEIVFVDYLQLMTGEDGKEVRKSGNREQEIASIARALKNMSKELNVPVVALSQLSRAVETRGGSKRPQMSDLRESGEIENAADFVGFLWRPEYYEIKETGDGDYPDGHTEIIFGKNRHGKASINVPICFIDRLCLFTDVDTTKSFYGGMQAPNAPPPTDYTIPASAKPDTNQDIPF